MFNEKYCRQPIAESRNPFTCGVTGKTYTNAEVKQRVGHLSRAIAKRLEFLPNEGTEWDKVVGLFSLNTVGRPSRLAFPLSIHSDPVQIDFVPVAHAVHRLSGIVTPASAAYSAQELEHQLRSSSAKALFTCIPLLDTALQAAKGAGISEDRIFLLPVPGVEKKTPFPTVDDLIEQGKSLQELEPLKWVKGQGARQVAFLCYSSGTSGLPVSENATRDAGKQKERNR